MRKFLGEAVLGLMLAGSVSAGPISFSSAGGQSTEGIGAFSGTIQYHNNQLTLTLTNQNTPQQGGYITAFAFMVPDAVTGVSLASYSYGFDTLLGPGVSAPPLGTFDFGLSTNGSWTGGGPPQQGVPVGGTGTFVFNISGLLAPMTTQQFYDLIANPSNPTGQMPDSWLAVRFRGGLDPNGWSDKVTPGWPLTDVPEPSTYLMLGSAFAGLALLRLRRRA